MGSSLASLVSRMKMAMTIRRGAGRCCGSVLLLAAATHAAEPVATAWVQRYSHAASAQSEAIKVVADHSGHAIVGGWSDDGENGKDYLLIKYSGAGVAIWTNRYGGLGSSDERASDVAVDANDNVFVTGIANGDYTTIAYA